MNDCTNAGEIVSAANKAAAKAAWPYCESQCTGCIAPAVEVFCSNGVCAGSSADILADGSTALMQDHCGVDGPAGKPESALCFGCGCTGTTGSGSSSRSGTASSSGSGSSSSSGAGSGDAGCTGNSAAWASITSGPITCHQNSDCCVIVNDCTYEAQVVSAANVDAGLADWPTCQNECTHCMSPTTYVGCYSGVCGANVMAAESDGGVMGTHCGINPTPPTGTPAGTNDFTCNGSGA